MSTSALAALVPGAIEAATAQRWLQAIDAHPAWSRRGACGGDAFDVHSSSLRVGAVPEVDAAAIAGLLLRGSAGELGRKHLGDRVACNVDQCWVRRQYAPSRYPPGHAPHAWHQDGALGFDFLAATRPGADDTLLAMLTCWIALTPCGSDAPGLELVVRDPGTLLPVAALDDRALRSGHDAGDFWRPLMQPGDCLVFCGSVLHRTHVSKAMRADRTSIELRFFDATRSCPRLRGDRFVAVH